MAIEEEFSIVRISPPLYRSCPPLCLPNFHIPFAPLPQEIPDEEADNITTVQQAIDYIAKSPEGKHPPTRLRCASFNPTHSNSLICICFLLSFHSAN